MKVHSGVSNLSHLLQVGVMFWICFQGYNNIVFWWFKTNIGKERNVSHSVLICIVYLNPAPCLIKKTYADAAVQANLVPMANVPTPDLIK